MKWLTNILLACLPLGAALILFDFDGSVRAQDPGADPAPAVSGDEPAVSDDEEEPVAQKTARQAIPIEAISWMEGTWRGNGLGGAVEEHWTPIAGGSMTGMFRLVQEDVVSFHQFMVIEEQDGRTWLRLKHFNPGYVPWEKTGPLLFELVEVTDHLAVFESPDPKQAPARVTYTGVGVSGLRIKIESPSDTGVSLAIEALYKRVTW